MDLLFASKFCKIFFELLEIFFRAFFWKCEDYYFLLQLKRDWPQIKLICEDTSFKKSKYRGKKRVYTDSLSGFRQSHEWQGGRSFLPEKQHGFLAFLVITYTKLFYKQNYELHRDPRFHNIFYTVLLLLFFLTNFCEDQQFNPI